MRDVIYIWQRAGWRYLEEYNLVIRTDKQEIPGYKNEWRFHKGWSRHWEAWQYLLQLINIGEALKHIDKLTDAKLLENYPEIDWKKAKGLRDIITHHYFDIDAETVFTVCKNHVPAMKEVIIKIVNDLKRWGLPAYELARLFANKLTYKDPKGWQKANE